MGGCANENLLGGRVLKYIEGYSPEELRGAYFSQHVLLSFAPMTFPTCTSNTSEVHMELMPAWPKGLTGPWLNNIWNNKYCYFLHRSNVSLNLLGAHSGPIFYFTHP
jgi:hypothetical protein